jgi:multicomponent Na+:H+ antiporter subunit F
MPLPSKITAFAPFIVTVISGSNQKHLESIGGIRSMPEILNAYYVWLAVVLLCTMFAGLIRVVLGPEPADMMLGAQLFGSIGVAVLLLLGQTIEGEALRNVALVFVLLSLLATIAFVERTPPGTETEDQS